MQSILCKIDEAHIAIFLAFWDDLLADFDLVPLLAKPSYREDLPPLQSRGAP
jgi:hypothetical protein